MHKQGIYEKYFKRCQDFLFAAVGLVVLSPVLLVLAVMVRIKLGSPILFKQDRPGRILPKTGQEKIFKLYKFRSMTDACDVDGNMLPDEERLTKFGRALRATSLDELPELINILKGDMALVGPRPLLVKYLSRYSDHQRRRHEVRPGLTGLAQVNGRNAISWEEKFEYDVQYVENITFFGDWRILYKTVWSVLAREGINSEAAATMDEFMGNKDK